MCIDLNAKGQSLRLTAPNIHSTTNYSTWAVKKYSPQPQRTDVAVVAATLSLSSVQQSYTTRPKAKKTQKEKPIKHPIEVVFQDAS
jgi:hypothetical protein